MKWVLLLASVVAFNLLVILLERFFGEFKTRLGLVAFCLFVAGRDFAVQRWGLAAFDVAVGVALMALLPSGIRNDEARRVLGRKGSRR